jgi:hypothetical protein
MEQIIKETILKISKNIPIIPSPTNLAPELNELKFSFPSTFIGKRQKDVPDQVSIYKDSKNKFTANPNTCSFKASCSHSLVGIKITPGAKVQISCSTTKDSDSCLGRARHWINKYSCHA